VGERRDSVDPRTVFPDVPDGRYRSRRGARPTGGRHGRPRTDRRTAAQTAGVGWVGHRARRGTHDSGPDLAGAVDPHSDRAVQRSGLAGRGRAAIAQEPPGGPVMRLSVSLTSYSWAGPICDELSAIARDLDRTPVDTLWVADHLLQADPSSDPAEPMLE